MKGYGIIIIVNNHLIIIVYYVHIITKIKPKI